VRLQLEIKLKIFQIRAAEENETSGFRHPSRIVDSGFLYSLTLGILFVQLYL
jgi:hypothetical protein